MYYFSRSFAILAAGLVIGFIILPLAIELLFSLGPIGFIFFLLVIFFVGSQIFER